MSISLTGVLRRRWLRVLQRPSERYCRAKAKPGLRAGRSGDWFPGLNEPASSTERENGLISFEYSDGGRRAVGYQGDADDCGVRALAILLGEDLYGELYRELANAVGATGRSRSARNGIPTKVFDRIAADYGVRRVKLPKGPRPTYSEAYDHYGDCIVRTTKHWAAITAGALRDTFDERTYEMPHEVGMVKGVPFTRKGGTFERKAQAVYVKTDPSY